MPSESIMTDRNRLDDHALDQIFREARTHIAWLDRPVSDELLRQAVELAKMGPTSANCLPMRIVFVRSKESKERLRPTLAPGNIDKTMAAPATAIIGYDLEFYEFLPRLFPRSCARPSSASPI
jgi:3-hydroxypropanoate dehydrogenase